MKFVQLQYASFSRTLDTDMPCVSLMKRKLSWLHPGVLHIVWVHSKIKEVCRQSVNLICLLNKLLNEDLFCQHILKLEYTADGASFNDIICPYMSFWPHPNVTSFTLRWKFYLCPVLLTIPLNLICHMTMFGKNTFLTPKPPMCHP